MLRFESTTKLPARSSNTENTKSKALSRLHIAGKFPINPGRNVVDNIFAQNINYVLPVHNNGVGRWRKTEDELEDEEILAQQFVGFTKHVLRLFGIKVFTNKTQPEGRQRYIVFKLIRAWPSFPEETINRLWNQDLTRHEACLNSLEQLMRFEEEKENRSADMTLVRNMPPFVKDVLVTVVVVLPENFPGHNDDQLKMILPVRRQPGGPLQENIAEWVMQVPDELSLESLLYAIAKYQRDYQPFRQVRQPKFIQLLRGSDPSNPRLIPEQPAAIELYNDFDFHMRVSAEAPAILGARTRNGIHFLVNMHPFVRDKDIVNNVIANVRPDHPVQRYANYSTYIDKTWPFCKQFSSTADAESWVCAGNPNKRLLPALPQPVQRPGGRPPRPVIQPKATIPRPIRQEQSDDDDEDDDGQHRLFLDRRARRIAEQEVIFRESFLRGAGKTVAQWHKLLRTTFFKSLPTAAERLAAGRRKDEEMLLLREQEALGARGKPNHPFLTQRELGIRLDAWSLTLPQQPANQTTAERRNLALNQYRLARTRNPGVANTEAILADAMTYYRTNVLGLPNP